MGIYTELIQRVADDIESMSSVPDAKEDFFSGRYGGELCACPAGKLLLKNGLVSVPRVQEVKLWLGEVEEALGSFYKSPELFAKVAFVCDGDEYFTSRAGLVSFIVHLTDHRGLSSAEVVAQLRAIALDDSFILYPHEETEDGDWYELGEAPF